MARASGMACNGHTNLRGRGFCPDSDDILQF